MSNNYHERLVDRIIELYLKLFKSIELVGPKWCGKTSTGFNYANSVVYFTDEQTKKMAEISSKYILTTKIPEVIDEWQILPEYWDIIRNECDSRSTRGNFILTRSVNLSTRQRDQMYHPGTGRITSIRMYPMSLYELGLSNDIISLKDMYEGIEIGKLAESLELEELAELIVNGGWPGNINLASNSDEGKLAKEYLNSIVSNDISENIEFSYLKDKMDAIIKALAMNEASYTSDSKIEREVSNITNKKVTISKNTLIKYLGILDKLYLTNNSKAYLIKYRSSAKLNKSDKRYLVDPSLACAALNLNSTKLMKDFNTFGLLFESLVVRDLNIFMEYYRGSVYAFRDNNSGDEVDAIVEFEDGEYGAIEIKLGQDGIDEAIKSLTKFRDNVSRKPKFLCVIVGIYSALLYDKENGVYIVPYNFLGMHFTDNK